MDEDAEQIAVALGLLRRAASLLEQAGEAAMATRLRAMIRQFAPPETTDLDLDPDLACLIAGIKLS